MPGVAANPWVEVHGLILCEAGLYCAGLPSAELAVHFIVELLAEGWPEDEVLDNYPGIAREDIRACLTDAAALLESERVDPIEIQA